MMGGAAPRGGGAGRVGSLAGYAVGGIGGRAFADR